jgi:hypothetical protein
MGCFGDNSQTQENKINYTPEAQAAQKTWWDKLQSWGSDANYGAISPDWNDIWDLASKKISQYYWGDVGTTGAAGKVKASAARRGVSQSPALENSLALLSMDEASNISDMAKQEAINKATFAEQGRESWLNSLMNLAGYKSGSTTTQTTEDDTLSSLLGALTSAGLGIATGGNSFGLESLLKGLGSSQSALVSGMGSVNVAPANYYLGAMA